MPDAVSTSGERLQQLDVAAGVHNRRAALAASAIGCRTLDHDSFSVALQLGDACPHGSLVSLGVFQFLHDLRGGERTLADHTQDPVRMSLLHGPLLRCSPDSSLNELAVGDASLGGKTLFHSELASRGLLLVLRDLLLLLEESTEQLFDVGGCHE